MRVNICDYVIGGLHQAMGIDDLFFRTRSSRVFMLCTTNPGHDGKVSAGKLAREIIDLSENFPGCI